MYLRDFDLFAGERLDSPEIIWENNDRYALIAFLFLSVDGRMNDEDLKKFDAFMNAGRVKAKNNDGCEDENIALSSVRDLIIREGGIFLDSLEQDESYCDYVLDEIDRIIDGNEKCNIGNGYMPWGRTTKHKELPGAAYILFDYVKLLDSGNDYSKNQKRIIKHLAQKWDVDKSVLTVLKDSVKTLDEISKKRHEIENSDIPHREALSTLAELDTREKLVWKELNALNIAKDRATSAYVTHTNAVADAIARLGGEPTWVRIRDEDKPYEEEEEEEESLCDRIGDGIVEGIHKVGDLLCAPFDWMTGKLIDWM
jgi:hypothetical protein